MPDPGRRRSWAWFLFATIAKVLAIALLVAIPALGVWVASSLAAYHDHPMAVSLVVGALCFPILPIAWEGWAARRRRRTPRRSWLTWRDRLVLRTLVLNVGFLGALLAAYPSTVFAALSSRGDWMLRDVDARWANPTREVLFEIADHLRWLHEWTHPNAYDELIDDTLKARDVEPPAPAELPAPHVPPEAEPSDAEPTPPPAMEPTLHPLVAALPPEEETSFERVARYLAHNEPDPRARLKAIHDYVADRIAYDVAALRSGGFPPQDARAVFDRRTAVCAGYSALFARMAAIAGLEVVVVVGKSREDDGALSPLGHAWNAAKIDDRWHLVDVTWDAGFVNGDAYTKKYRTAYFMAPPAIFGRDHFPDDPRWQLRAEPLSLGEFIRQPQVTPEFTALGLTLRSPDRAPVLAKPGASITIEIDNPQSLPIIIDVRVGNESRGPCRADATYSNFECTILGERDQQLVLFGPPEDVRIVRDGASVARTWTHQGIGKLPVEVL